MAGSSLGVDGPIKLRNPGLLLDVRLAPGSQFQQVRRCLLCLLCLLLHVRLPRAASSSRRTVGAQCIIIAAAAVPTLLALLTAGGNPSPALGSCSCPWLLIATLCQPCAHAPAVPPPPGCIII